MHTVAIGQYKLEVSESLIRYGRYEVPLDRVRGLNIIRKDNMAVVTDLLPTPFDLVARLLARLVGLSLKPRSISSSRFISVRGDNQTLRIDCTWAFADVDELNAAFDSAFNPIWQTAGRRLTAQLVSDLERGQTATIGDISICRDGVWLYGRRSTLFWMDKPTLVPWSDIEITGDATAPCIQSISDASRRGVLTINNVENATVMDAAIKHLLQDGNWKKLGGSPAERPSLN